MNNITLFKKELRDLTEAYLKKIQQMDQWTEEQILKGKMSEADALSEIANVNKQFNAQIVCLHIKHIPGFVEPTTDLEDETIASVNGKKPKYESKVDLNFSPQGISEA